MLKKAGYIILISLLIFSTVGFVVSRHYCNNEFISVSVDSPADKCSDKMNNDCCNDENRYVVLHVDFTKPVAEKIAIAEIDNFNIKLNLLFDESFSNVTFSNRLSRFFTDPGRKKIFSIVGSYLL